MESSPCLQESARPLLSDSRSPLYVLSIQERAEQLASRFEGKPVGPQVKFPLYFTFFGELAIKFTYYGNGVGAHTVNSSLSKLIKFFFR